MYNPTINKLNINSSIYDLIETHSLKKYQEYKGKAFLTPASCMLFAGTALAFENAGKWLGDFLNRISTTPISDGNFTLTYGAFALGGIWLASDFIKEQIKFNDMKYKLSRNGISVSTHQLKKAKTVVYHTETNDDHITKEYRAILLQKKNKGCILIERKAYILDNEDIPARYSISILPNDIENIKEKQFILNKINTKY